MGNAIAGLPEGARYWFTPEHRGDGENWPSGQWDDEPDKVSWTDPATGRPCLIHRNRMGALCGYVAVDPGHSLHGKDYESADVDVHGGLTYANACQETWTEDHGICHVPEPGAPDDVWWFGFDCAHMGDLVPSMHADRAGWPSMCAHLAHDTYRTVGYVVGECERLAAQLVDVP